MKETQQHGDLCAVCGKTKYPVKAFRGRPYCSRDCRKIYRARPAIKGEPARKQTKKITKGSKKRDG